MWLLFICTCFDQTSKTRKTVPDVDTVMLASSHTYRYGLAFWVVVTALLASCSSSWLPAELKLIHVLHQVKNTHQIGPGGINHSFTVYELPQDVAATIADKGLPYLNALPTRDKKVPRSTGPWWEPFNRWQTTPIPSEKAWLRYGRDLEKDWKPSLTTFFIAFKGDPNKNNFVSKISPEFSGSFHEAIATPGNFYAYGDYHGKSLVVVSPSMGRVFYLFRD